MNKKQKIVITGALGYLGSELCKLYSGETRYKNIVAIDNRFLSERVSQLRSWGIRFIQADILDEQKMKEILHDTDVCYHLAGITDVAYTATESNPEQDKRIKEVGIDGTLNIIKAVSKQCKIMFPSTHVVFEGLQETTFNIAEDAPNAPRLTYSVGKLISESDIESRSLVNKNHIIVRLGSVYGYSTDTMRINIMPNLFSKIASQDGTIALYGGGVQYKSMVHVVDAVRAMKYLAESDYTGTYHLSNENMTVREVAEICKSVNPKVVLKETDDEVPNKGYTLSNKKLLDTGFRFLYNIHDAILEMIEQWGEKNTDTPDEYIIRGQKEYSDSRGKISNYELTEPINLIGYITSVKGSVRANHYHPIQEQKCLLISGRYISVTQDLSYPDAPVEYKVIQPGDIAVIRPNVAHAMVFLQDSVFLNLVRGEREHENYGITHTISHILVDEDHRNRIMNMNIATMYRDTCRCCGSRDLTKVVDLGMSPLANNLLDSPEQQCDMYPLEMMYCSECYNAQLSVVVPAGKMFDNYLYVSSTSQVFRKHFEDAAEQYIRQFNLNSQSVVWDIGSNDGVFLRPLKEKGITVCGIEPAGNLAELANSNGIATIHGYFNHDTATHAYHTYGAPDIVTASNVFAHADDLAGITNVVFNNLKPNGVFIIEVQYLMDTIKDLTFDNIYHEHVNYWSVTALNTFFEKLGYCMFHVEHIDTHGGSIRCYISKDQRDNSTIQEYLNREGDQGIHQVETFKLFGQRISDIRNTVRANMKLLKQKYPRICGYGSPAKATTALNYFGITSEDIQYTIEDNELKCGKYLPGVNIPIGNHSYGPPQAPDVCIVLAWNFFESIVEKHKYMKGTKFISIKDLQIADGMPVLDTHPTHLKGQKSTGKVYDCFLFFNELNLLEIRLNILDPVVDYFVIVEANVTHSGKPREYCFEANKNKFTKWLDKIIYIKVDSMPEQFEDLSMYTVSSSMPQPVNVTYDQMVWNTIVYNLQSATNIDKKAPLQCREYWQRESIIRALGNCTPDDVIMLSDIDEMPNPDIVKAILNNFDNYQVYSLRQNSYYYKLNLLKERHWVGPRIASYSRFCEQPVGTFRHIRDLIISHGGWHFSFQTASGVANKLQAYSHADMATEDVMKNLDTRIANSTDPFNRGKLTKVEIDSTYPQYLLDNLEQYKHMIA